MLFSDPLHLMLFTDNELLEPPSVIDLLPPVADLPSSVPTPLPYPPDTAGSLLHYRSVDIRDVHPSQKRFFNNIGRQFSELSDTDGRVIAQWLISNVVAATFDPRVLYYQYHDAFHPPPAHDDKFEYSLCTIINRQSWSRFTTGSKIARAISNIDFLHLFPPCFHILKLRI
jgi:hypothetical protein